MNDEYLVGRISFDLSVDFNEKVHSDGSGSSSSASANIGCFFLQKIMKGLNLKQFFQHFTDDRKITLDCYTISLFLTYSRILDPASKLYTWNHPGYYYEQPSFDISPHSLVYGSSLSQ